MLYTLCLILYKVWFVWYFSLFYRFFFVALSLLYRCFIVALSLLYRLSSFPLVFHLYSISLFQQIQWSEIASYSRLGVKVLFNGFGDEMDVEWKFLDFNYLQQTIISIFFFLLSLFLAQTLFPCDILTHPNARAFIPLTLLLWRAKIQVIEEPNPEPSKYQHESNFFFFSLFFFFFCHQNNSNQSTEPITFCIASIPPPPLPPNPRKNALENCYQ